MRNPNLYILITIVITLCLQASCNSMDGNESAAAPVSPETVATALAQSDALFKQREDVSKLRAAIDILGKARDPNARNFEVEWKYAKYNYFLGKVTTNQKDAEMLFGQGREAGKIAMTLEPGKADGYFWYGADLGELCKMSPVMIGVKSIDDVQAAMNKVLELEPNYQNSSAYDALGQVELATRLTGGSAAKAVEIFEKGLQTEKDNSNIRLHLAEAYLALKRDTDARKQLDLLLQMKPNPDYLPEHKDCVEKAKKMLETKF